MHDGRLYTQAGVLIATALSLSLSYILCFGSVSPNAMLPLTAQGPQNLMIKTFFVRVPLLKIPWRNVNTRQTSKPPDLQHLTSGHLRCKWLAVSVVRISMTTVSEFLFLWDCK